MSIAARTLDALKEAGCEIEDARIAVLGYACLENSDDMRNSPSITLISRLEELGARMHWRQGLCFMGWGRGGSGRAVFPPIGRIERGKW